MSSEGDRFSFVIGVWSGTLRVRATATMPKAFPAEATMKSIGGPQRAWIESEGTAKMPGFGSYSAKATIRYDPKEETYDSFVVNASGNAARYTGTMLGNKFIFIGKEGPITRRITYDNVSQADLKVRIEESRDDGASYQTHSEILWKRR